MMGYLLADSKEFLILELPILHHILQVMIL